MWRAGSWPGPGALLGPVLAARNEARLGSFCSVCSLPVSSRNGRFTPSSASGPQKVPSMLTAALILGSSCMACALAAPPMDQPNMPTRYKSRPPARPAGSAACSASGYCLRRARSSRRARTWRQPRGACCVSSGLRGRVRHEAADTSRPPGNSTSGDSFVVHRDHDVAVTDQCLPPARCRNRRHWTHRGESTHRTRAVPRSTGAPTCPVVAAAWCRAGWCMTRRSARRPAASDRASPG